MQILQKQRADIRLTHLQPIEINGLASRIAARTHNVALIGGYLAALEERLRLAKVIADPAELALAGPIGSLDAYFDAIGRIAEWFREWQARRAAEEAGATKERDRARTAAIARHTNAFKINEDVVIPLERLGDYLDLLARDLDRGGIVARHDQLLERRRAGDVGALADIDEAGGGGLGH